MKKILSAILVLAFAIGMVTIAAEEKVNAKVSISAAGELVLAAEPVEVTDKDGDGSITLSDALACAHEEHYKGEGTGYATVSTQWGLGIESLWGIANGGSYGYYINNVSPFNLADPIKNGDHIYAYTYADLIGWTDSFTWLDAFEKETSVGSAVSFTVSNSSYDENWNSLTMHPEGASVYVNGEGSGIKTDENGAFSLTFDKAGEYIISVKSETAVLTPPVCKVTVRSFADIVGHWGANEIEKVIAAGLFSGTNNGFEPNLAMNRGMLVTVLWRHEGSPDMGGKTAFTDVPEAQWYAKAVKWASENGIVSGYGDTFRPMNAISRQELALILYNYAKFKGMDISASDSLAAFTDAASTASWALDSMKWAVGSGIIGGTGSKLDPAQSATRAQAAAVLIRFIGK